MELCQCIIIIHGMHISLHNITKTVVGIHGLPNDFKEGSQQQKGRNGTLIVNLGGIRNFQLETVVPVGNAPAKMKMTICLEHSSVMILFVAKCKCVCWYAMT